MRKQKVITLMQKDEMAQWTEKPFQFNRPNQNQAQATFITLDEIRGISDEEARHNEALAYFARLVKHSGPELMLKVIAAEFKLTQEEIEEAREVAKFKQTTGQDWFISLLVDEAEMFLELAIEAFEKSFAPAIQRGKVVPLVVLGEGEVR